MRITCRAAGLIAFAWCGLVLGQNVPPGEEPLRISPEVAAANLVARIDPIYPALSRAVRVQGTVTMDAMIDKEGKVADLKVVRGHPLLNEAAVEAVQQWRYKPYLKNGEPTDVLTSISLSFSFTTPTQAPGPGEIRGHIRHVDGEAAGLMPVAAVQLTGTRAVAPTFVARTLTDLSGEYRFLSIPAGRYRIEAGAIAATYFPGTTTLIEAVAVSMPPDLTAVSGVDFTMSGPVRVSGRVGGEISAAALGALRVALNATGQVLVVSDGPASPHPAYVSTSIRGDGAFEFDDVLPGTYTLSIQAGAPVVSSLGGQLIEVGGSDVKDALLNVQGIFVVQVQQGAGLPRSLAGRVTALDQSGRSAEPGQLQIGLVPVGPGADSNQATVISSEVDGSFSLPLTEGTWLVFFRELQYKGYAVRSISYGARNLLRESLALEPTTTEDEIRVTVGR